MLRELTGGRAGAAMSYAGAKRVLDADSHLMEWPSFLSEHASARIAAQLPQIGGDAAAFGYARREREAGERETLEGLGDALLRSGPKWHAALGAMEAGERGAALDRLGFERQVVFSSFCAQLFFIEDAQVRYAAYRAHNEAVAAFCSGDARLHGVALCDLEDPVRARAELDAALALGLGPIWLPARAPAARPPGDPRNDWFWATLAERSVPFVLHVGSAPLAIDKEWTQAEEEPPQQAGRRVVRPEVISAKDLLVIYQPFERFLATLVLDGVLERHPRLRGGAIEVGAGWVPDLLRRLDHAAAIWGKSEPRLAAFERKPSEQAAAQLRFTPYPFEDVGLLCRESDPRLYLFSSDYPHAEGGRDPIARFDRALAGHPPATAEAFYAGNALAWLPPRRGT
jgi:predicted TIM-barrel fold metal-dependent hydrolase